MPSDCLRHRRERSDGLSTMSESEPSQAQLQEDVLQSDDVDQPEQPFIEEPELQSVEEATALLRHQQHWQQ